MTGTPTWAPANPQDGQRKAAGPCLQLAVVAASVSAACKGTAPGTEQGQHPAAVAGVGHSVRVWGGAPPES
eukprot:1633936-Alexandrium_andersonii.AAC.1